MLGRNVWFATIFGIASLLVLRKVNAEPASRGLLVVANQKEHTVLVVDPDARRELAKVVVGVNGHEVMVSKDGRFAKPSLRDRSLQPLRSEEHTSELQSPDHLVCRLLLEKKKNTTKTTNHPNISHTIQPI